MDFGQCINAYPRATFDVLRADKALYAKFIPALWAHNCDVLKLARAAADP
jgi:hypothetical protein